MRFGPSKSNRKQIANEKRDHMARGNHLGSVCLHKINWNSCHKWLKMKI